MYAQYIQQFFIYLQSLSSIVTVTLLGLLTVTRLGSELEFILS